MPRCILRSSRAPALALLALCVAAPRAVRAQTTASAAPVDPATSVNEAAGTGVVLLRQVGRQTAARPRDWRVPLVTLRGQCYEVLAAAGGAARTS
jgi:hypothetical protein